jgi:hypothetical protein
MQRSIWPLRHSSISRPDHSKPSNSAPHHRVGVATEMGGSVGTKALKGLERIRLDEEKKRLKAKGKTADPRYQEICAMLRP